ncbi:MAG: TetR family transcriptional regulator [Corynebacterium sp.]|nr:TetR family transcriptional regulator [Corynebacterium sp.]
MATFREEKKQRTRLRLAVSTVDLINEGGPEAATIQTITTRAEVSPRTFHNYFDSREDALIFFTEQLCQEIVDGFAKVTSATNPLEVAAHSLELLLTKPSNPNLTPARVIGITNLTSVLTTEAIVSLHESLADQMITGFITATKQHTGIELNPQLASMTLEIAFATSRYAVIIASDEPPACFPLTPAHFGPHGSFDVEIFQRVFRDSVDFVENNFTPLTDTPN